MKSIGLEMLTAEIAAVTPVVPVGRVKSLSTGVISVSGLSATAALGDQVEIAGRHASMRGEIVALSSENVSVMPDESPEGLQIDDRVFLIGSDDIAPHDSWIGRVIDPYGNALDGEPILRGHAAYPLRGKPPRPTERRGLGPRMETGMAVFNTMLPIVRGQRIGLFAGSGVGKTTLLARLAMGVQADIVVIALIGERGREVRDFVEKVLGAAGMDRTIVVAATSDMSPVARRRCGWAAMAVAEYFRDQGNQVLFMADSVTRFADAHRDVALATGELAGPGGYPPSMASLVAGLCERAGPGTQVTGDITAVFSVLVAGSDMEEPVADVLRGVLDGHVVLDRRIAERGRFPAIDVLRSVSRSLPEAASEDENALIATARERLGTYDRSEMMIQAGLYSSGSDPAVDAAIAAFPQLDRFVSMREPDDSHRSFVRLAECLAG